MEVSGGKYPPPKSSKSHIWRKMSFDDQFFFIVIFGREKMKKNKKNFKSFLVRSRIHQGFFFSFRVFFSQSFLVGKKIFFLIFSKKKILKKKTKFFSLPKLSFNFFLHFLFFSPPKMTKKKKLYGNQALPQKRKRNTEKWFVER